MVAWWQREAPAPSRTGRTDAGCFGRSGVVLRYTDISAKCLYFSNRRPNEHDPATYDDSQPATCAPQPTVEVLLEVWKTGDAASKVRGPLPRRGRCKEVARAIGTCRMQAQIENEIKKCSLSKTSNCIKDHLQETRHDSRGLCLGYLSHSSLQKTWTHKSIHNPTTPSGARRSEMLCISSWT